MAEAGAPAMTPAEKYEQFFVPAMFGPFARRLVALAAPVPGGTALDLACGTGIVARTIAPTLGPSGRVVGLDLRPGMLAVARSLPAPVEWLEGDATRLDLPDGLFDHVLCQAGLQFFPDRPRALREIRRVLKPGGRLALLVWQGLERQPVFAAMAGPELRHLAGLGVTEEDILTPFSMGDPEALRALLAEAGFSGIAVAGEVREADFPGDDFVRNVEYGFAAVIPEFAADPAAFDAFVAAVEEDCRAPLAAHRRGDRIVFPLAAHFATAEVPA